MSESPRYRPDDLRRLATELLSRAGLARERASALGRLLLWYDAIGAHDFGIVGLGDWLTRLDHGDFDPKQQGRVGPEHASTAVLEASGGLPPLLLARAAEIAGQKARDTGVGIVRVIGLPPSAGPAAAIAADLAIGPFLGLVLGPGSAQSAAIPAPEGVPLIFDSILGDAGGEIEVTDGPTTGDEPMRMIVDRVAPWLLLSGAQEVVVVALAVAAFESLGSFHRRVAEALEGRTAPAGWIFPEAWERHRSEAQQRGIALAESVIGPLRERSAKAGVGFPSPVA
ncbi:Ldh family oxidoreductase [Tautonia rosea]|uniref:Ldh family oxidoreductase n=1 Tax=Tautonia rosea TaxID=2728037 RepID=UPI00147490F2|nr:Ldh family oxidoreductase [Tautonia rosea]